MAFVSSELQDKAIQNHLIKTASHFDTVSRDMKSSRVSNFGFGRRQIACFNGV